MPSPRADLTPGMLRTQKVIKKGNELIIFIHFQVQAFVWMRQGNHVEELLVEVKARNPEDVNESSCL